MTELTPTGSVAPTDRGFFGHPRALATLFATELWERFSFYGMRAILVLYLTASVADGGWAWGEGNANSLYGVYNGFVYLTALPGAWVADRLIGARRSVLIGGITIALGHFSLALDSHFTFFLGLILIVSGTGLLKPNMSAMVGELYARDDPRRDAGFSIFYMGINIGAFAAPLVVGTLAQEINWHVGFAAAGVGMTIAVIWYVVGGGLLGNIGKTIVRPLAPHESARLVWLFPVAAIGGLALAVALVFLLMVMFGLDIVASFLLVLTFVPIVLAIVYFWRMFADSELGDVERSRLAAYVYLFMFASAFWLIYDQAGSVVNIFTDKHVDRTVPFFGELSAATFQAINPLWIVIGAPLAAMLWMRLGNRVSTPVKFSIGLVINGLSFILMGLAAQAAVGGALISPWWIVAVYAVQVAGELAISPVGLSVTTKLAPARYYSQMMGLWFLSTAVGDAIGGQVARLQGVWGDVPYFTLLGSASVVLGLGAFGFTRKLRGMMRGIV